MGCNARLYETFALGKEMKVMFEYDERHSVVIRPGWMHHFWTWVIPNMTNSALIVRILLNLIKFSKKLIFVCYKITKFFCLTFFSFFVFFSPYKKRMEFSPTKIVRFCYLFFVCFRNLLKNLCFDLDFGWQEGRNEKEITFFPTGERRN